MVDSFQIPPDASYTVIPLRLDGRNAVSANKE